MKLTKFKKAGADFLKQHGHKLAQAGFKQIFEHINQLNIKKGVDKMGLDKFIEQCAWLAAGSGVVSGSGGLLTLAAGIPFDFANLVTQPDTRVTMAVMYHNRGTYQLSFEEFISLVAASLKVEAGVAISKTVMEGIAEKLLLMLGTRTAERMVPVVGGVIGGGTNYLFIKRMAKSVKEMQRMTANSSTSSAFSASSPDRTGTRIWFSEDRIASSATRFSPPVVNEQDPCLVRHLASSFGIIAGYWPGPLQRGRLIVPQPVPGSCA